MTENQALRNVRLYKWYIAFKEPLFWGPILISTLMNLGQMELPEIYFMEAVVILGLVFLEVPSGALADLIGRKKTVIAGSILNTLSIGWFAFMTSPLDAWIANLLWMIGLSLTSGADTALFYDSLKLIKKEQQFVKIEGTTISNKLLLIAFCSLAVGFLAEVSLRLPLLLCLPTAIIPPLIASFMTESTSTGSYSARAQANLMKTSVLFVANHKKVKWITFFSTLIASASGVWFFTYNPYFELVSLDLKYYGFLFFLLNIIAWGFSRFAYVVEEKLGERSTVVLLLGCVALPIFVMGTIVTKASTSMILLQNVARGLLRPFIGGMLHGHLESDNRATAASIKSAVTGFVNFLALNAFGVMLEIWSLPFCLITLSVTVTLLGVWLIFKYDKIFR